MSVSLLQCRAGDGITLLCLLACTPQDFLQILSMFAGFKFDWPVALSTLFNIFSLVNFNMEILAPECSFSVNFEAKWLVVQLLPVMFLVVVALVVTATRIVQWVQQRVLHVLPFGAASDVSVLDTGIGVLITGLFHLYLGVWAP